MANQEHLDILGQGVETWNKWRQEHPEVKPDLSEADLSNRALTGFITRKFTFGYHPNFYRASIIGVDLTGANLARVNLSKVDMAGADMNAANLTEAVLIEANLINADLSGATLNRAKLTKANLSSAALVGTDLNEADLSEVTLFKSELTLSNLISWQENKLYQSFLATLDETKKISKILNYPITRKISHSRPRIVRVVSLSSHFVGSPFFQPVKKPRGELQFRPR